MERDLRYPLAWPVGWPRTRRDDIQSSRFLKPFKSAGAYSQAARQYSMAEATDMLIDELRMLGATPPRGFSHCVISTNVALRNDGLPRSGQKQPEDQGAAVYFVLKGRPQVLACDKWKRLEDNIRAMAAHVGALRSIDRWGVGSIERAFEGYLALPETTGRPSCWQVLGLDSEGNMELLKQGKLGEELIKTARRAKLQLYHPDKVETADPVKFAEVEEAYRDAMRQIGAL